MRKIPQVKLDDDATSMSLTRRSFSVIAFSMTILPLMRQMDPFLVRVKPNDDDDDFRLNLTIQICESNESNRGSIELVLVSTIECMCQSDLHSTRVPRA